MSARNVIPFLKKIHAAILRNISLLKLENLSIFLRHFLLPLWGQDAGSELIGAWGFLADFVIDL